MSAVGMLWLRGGHAADVDEADVETDEVGSYPAIACGHQGREHGNGDDQHRHHRQHDDHYEQRQDRQRHTSPSWMAAGKGLVALSQGCRQGVNPVHCVD